MAATDKRGARRAKGRVQVAKKRRPAASARSTSRKGRASRTSRSVPDFVTRPSSTIKIRINGQWREFDRERDLSPSMTLAYLLKEKLGLTGLKIACGEGACGACTVIMDGKAVLSCMMLALEADGHDILTIEGLPKDDPVLEAFAQQSEPGYGTALQCGYCTPGFVMAARALLNENPRPTLDEVKEALSGNICRCGCYAAIAQAVLHASEKDGGQRRPTKTAQPFTPRKARPYVGGYRPRIDGLEKASGRALYADDVAIKARFPDMLYAKILRSPHAHARITRLDTTKAEKLPGVKAILTYQDPEVASLKPTSAGWTDGVDTVSYERMMWKRFRDRRVLSDYVCWVGDEAGVVVAAETEAIAEEALGLIEVQWEVLPFVLDPLEAMKPGAPAIHPDIAPHNVLPADPIGGPDVYLTKGDIEKGFAMAEVVAEATSVYHNANQGTLDNWCCLAKWDHDKLTLWSNSYEADQTRMHVSQMLEMPLHKVRVISNFVGGQFGRNDTGDQPLFLFTALLAKKAGRPVKFKHTRREAFHDSRQSAIYSSKIGARKDGTITALSFKAIGNVGAYADHSMFALKFAPAEVAEVAFAHIPHLKMEAYGVYTNVLPGCMMRGVGNSQLNLILGHIVDVLAEKIRMDPIDLVIKNFGHQWEQLPDKSLKAVLTEGARRIGWEEKRYRPGAGPVYDGVKKRGVGFSFHPGWHAGWQEMRRGQIQVAMRLNPDGTVMLEAPTVETGPGSNTCNVLGCAEALDYLGIRPDDIYWIATVDTDTSLKDTVQTDSAASYLQSEVMVDAAQALKKKILEAAASRFEAHPEELDIGNGRIFPKSSPEKGIPFQEVLWQGDLAPIVVTASRAPTSEKTGVPFLAAFAEVEVDTSTGRVQVRKLVILNDCGTVMYASGAEAQQIGGQCAGVGESLTEEIIYDKATGVPLNFNWIDYKIPTIADMPTIEPVLLEVWRGAGEYGACGIGESVLTCTPRAILNAVYHAIGVRIDDIPIKPEKVLRALGTI